VAATYEQRSDAHFVGSPAFGGPEELMGNPPSAGDNHANGVTEAQLAQAGI